MTGRALGDAIANVLTFTDGIAVIGGGITGARDFYMPEHMEELNSNFDPSVENSMSRLAIATSKLGASEAISLGAYAFALQHIDS